MTTQKREYEKPSMQVFELKQQSALLAGSAGVQNYTWHDEDEE